MENKKVMVVSKTNGKVGINLPDQHFRMVWEKKGAKKPIPFEVLEQGIYDQGVENMFKQGILYIEDMATKIALGLEPEEAKEPQNIVVLEDKQKERFLTVAPVRDFTEMLTTLSYEQALDLTDYAIEHEHINMEKCDLLKKKTGIDVVRAVQLNRDNKEA